MKLNEIGEFGLIQRLASRFKNRLPHEITGIGDDCAIIPHQTDSCLLVTTDLFLEHVHFILNQTTPENLGYKALAVNLSDIAAMGGTPRYAFLSLGLPDSISVEWIDRFIDGLDQLAQKENVLILGGDTTRSLTDLTVNLVVLGEAHPNRIKKRSTATAGDLICCTNYLGDSGAGLKILLNDIPTTTITQPLIDHHQCPKPAIKEGQWLATHSAVHAMIDLSDGVDSDIRHIMEQSKCGARIHLDQLPLSSSLIQTSKQFGWNAQELAVTAGEDYGLLFTIDPHSVDFLKEAYEAAFRQPFFVIGEITNTLSTLTYFMKGQPVELIKRGFDHFSKVSYC